MDKSILFENALKARNLSYSPYSKFKVGAALLTKNNEVYLGTNIENASYGLSMCAERNAIYNAYLHNVRKDDIEALMIVADTKDACSPCGACRQVLSEMFPKGKPIYLCNLSGIVKELTIDDLLPYSFGEEDLK